MSAKRWIAVVELDDTLPGRVKTKQPHLYLCSTGRELEKLLDYLRRGAGHGPESFRGHYARLRQDLCPTPGPFTDPAECRKHRADLKRTLARQGFAINGGSHVWHGYVIDLKPPKGKEGDGKHYVYVGQTSLTPEARFKVHMTKPEPGKHDLGSKVVRGRSLGLNYRLMAELEPRSPVFLQADALSLEKQWALALARRGYVVKAGDATPGRSRKKPKPPGKAERRPARRPRS